MKPGVQRKTHLLAAAILWSCIGLMLMGRGLAWLLAADVVVLVVPALLLGFLKSRYILDRTADRTIDRIMLLSDGTCLGAVYSKKTWGLVLAMMAMGYALRHSEFPRVVLAAVYVMVGSSLAWSSRKGWRAWWYWRF